MPILNLSQHTVIIEKNSNYAFVVHSMLETRALKVVTDAAVTRIVVKFANRTPESVSFALTFILFQDTVQLSDQ